MATPMFVCACEDLYVLGLVYKNFSFENLSRYSTSPESLFASLEFVLKSQPFMYGSRAIRQRWPNIL
eukprot:2500214-Karenia_brevis.AAC.1